MEIRKKVNNQDSFFVICREDQEEEIEIKEMELNRFTFSYAEDQLMAEFGGEDFCERPTSVRIYLSPEDMKYIIEEYEKSKKKEG